MKRIGYVLLTIALIAAVMCIPVLATGGVTAGEVSAIAGQEVTLDVYVSDHAEVNSMGIQYTLPEGLSLVKAEWLLTGMGDVDTSKTQGVWMNMQPVDLTEKTAVFRFTFIALAPAADATDLVQEVAIKLSFDDGEWHSVTGKVTVTNPATAISVDKPSLQLDPCTGGAALNATVWPATTTDKVEWSSSNENVVTVSGGVITVVGEGTATVTAQAGDVKASCSVTVSHSFGTDWHFDETGHWHKCANGDAASEVKPHDLQWKVDQEPNDQVDGIQHKECATCGYKTEENTPIPHTHKSTEHKAVAATCIQEGNVRYFTCSHALCEGKFYSDKECTVVLSKVTTGIDENNHVNTELQGEKKPTCFQEGYTGDTYCNDCKKVVKTGKTENPTGNHVAGTEWYSDGTNHWHLCTTENCTAKLDTAAHNWKWETDQAATALENGSKHEECTVCHAKRNENTVVPHTHKVTEHAAQAATCTQEGNVRYFTCESPLCEGKLYSNAACTKEITSIVVAKDPENHVKMKLKGQVSPTCYQEGYSGDKICAACGTLLVKGEKQPATGRHTAAEAYLSDGTHHWHACRTAGCTAKVDYTKHSFHWVVDKAATEYETGLKHEVCDCGKSRSEGTVIPKLDHVHRDIQHVAGVAATCVKEGTLEYWTCGSSLCKGKFYGDPECQLELESIVAPINPKNHAGKTELKGVKEVTCTEDGYTGDTHCVDCDAVIALGETISALGHDMYWVIDQYPTEETEGRKHQICNNCGFTCDIDTPIEKLEHLPALVEKKDPTCENAGVQEHFYCANCGRSYESDAGAPGKEISADSVILESLGHSYATEWTTDETGHWHSCACGDKADYAEHTPETVGAEAPAVGKPGYTGDTVCSVCGHKIAEGEEIPAETTAPPTTAAPTTQTPATQPGDQTGNGGFPWWILLIPVAAAAVVVLWLLLRKRNKKQ